MQRNIQHLCTILAISLFFVVAAQAQSWEPLAYNPDQDSLELNPIKGLTPLYNVSNEFPHSVRGLILGFDQIMFGIDNFDWTPFDNFISELGDEGRFSYLQVNVDMGFNRSDLPAFLSNVPRIYYDGSDPDDGAGVPSMVVDYNHPEMMAAMLNFIERFGEKYNNNPRVWLVHYGLYGIFGEWDLGFGKKFVPQGEDWAMSQANQKAITDAYELEFSDKNLLARFPENVPESQAVGYSDGLYFGGSVSEDPNFFWFFHPKLQINHADLNWKNHPIGGEVDPDVQPYVWEQYPNNVVGLPQVSQNTEEALVSTRPTFLFHDYVFNDLCKEGDPLEWANAIQATKRTGYTFHVNEYRLTAENSKPVLEVNIHNKGLAPMYANWDAEFGYIDQSGNVVSLGTSDSWNLRTIQPDVENNYRSLHSTVNVPDGTHTFVMRIINPLETISSKAKPVRFANVTQDADKIGWLTLGQATLTSGNLGSTPTRVGSLQLIPATKTMGLQEQFQLNAQVFPGIATNKEITWTSDRPRTASVDENGLVTSYNLSGEVLIEAYTQDGGVVRSSVITVEPFWSVPGRVEAEGFSAFNNAQTLPAPVQEGGGQVIGFIDNTTFLEYELNVAQTANYVLDFRASSPFGTFNAAVINVLDENQNVLTEVSFSPSTPIPLDENCEDNQLEAFNTFQTYRSDPISLTSGSYTIRIDVEASSFNLNWIEFKIDPCEGFDPLLDGTACDDGELATKVDSFKDCECVGIPEEAFTAIPAKIEAEEYYDAFEARRDVKAPVSEGCSRVIAFLNDNSWMEYPIYVDKEIEYTASFRASSPNGDFGSAIVDVLDTDGTILTTVSFSPSTASGNDFGLFTSSAFTLSAGYHKIRIDVVTSNFDLNWLEFEAVDCVALEGANCDDENANTENDVYIANCDCQGTQIADPFIPIPAKIEAEDYSLLNDAQVNPAPSSEGGGDVIGFITDDTWMEYKVSVSEESYFELDARASSPFGVAALELLNENGQVLTTMTLSPATPNFDDYALFTSPVFLLPVGEYRLRLDVLTSAFNLNWIEFKQVTGCDVPIGGSCNDGDPNTANDVYTSECECKGVPAVYTLIPGRVQAEDYIDVFDAQINPAPIGEIGGSVLGFIGDDTWIDYAVRVNQESDFEIELRASSPFGIAVIDLLNENGEVLTSVALNPATADFDSYTLYTSSVFTLPKGCYRLRVDVVTSALNLNWIKFRDVQNCVPANAGTLTDATVNISQNGSALIGATVDTEPIVPACSVQQYILSHGEQSNIVAISNVPEFIVLAGGDYRIHNFVFDETIIDLSQIEFGTTTIADIEQLMQSGIACPTESLNSVGLLLTVGELCVDELNLAGIESDRNYQASTTITSEQTITGQEVMYSAGQSITLNNGFEVEAGTAFTVQIEACK